MLTRCRARCTAVRPRSSNPTSTRQSSVGDAWRLPESKGTHTCHETMIHVNFELFFFSRFPIVFEVFFLCCWDIESAMCTLYNQYSIFSTVPPWAPIWSRCTSTVRHDESAVPVRDTVIMLLSLDFNDHSSDRETRKYWVMREISIPSWPIRRSERMRRYPCGSTCAQTWGRSSLLRTPE